MQALIRTTLIIYEIHHDRLVILVVKDESLKALLYRLAADELSRRFSLLPVMCQYQPRRAELFQ